MLFDSGNTAPPVCLAPMAGVSDFAFRQIVKEFGPSLMFTEMISAKALYYHDKKTMELLKTSPNEGPLYAQIFGSDPAIMAYAAQEISQMGAFAGIDINAGCPTPKIVNNGEGSALMQSPALLGRIIESTAKSTSLPVSVKMRLGWDQKSINAVECAKIAEESGARFLTVHGRTRDMFYSGNADYDQIKKVVDSVSIPVIANGDVFDHPDALHLLRHTGAYGVMIARGAQGNPWIFRRVQDALSGGNHFFYPTTQDKLKMAKKHLSLLIETKGRHIGLLEARKHIAWYLKGIPGGSHLKEQVFRAVSQSEMEELLSGEIPAQP